MPQRGNDFGDPGRFACQKASTCLDHESGIGLPLLLGAMLLDMPRCAWLHLACSKCQMQSGNAREGFVELAQTAWCQRMRRSFHEERTTDAAGLRPRTYSCILSAIGGCRRGNCRSPKVAARPEGTPNAGQVDVHVRDHELQRVALDAICERQAGRRGPAQKRDGQKLVREAVGQARHVSLALQKHLQQRSSGAPTASAASAQRGTLACMWKCLVSGDTACTKAASRSSLLRPSRLANMVLTLDRVSAVSRKVCWRCYALHWRVSGARPIRKTLNVCSKCQSSSTTRPYTRMKTRCSGT